MVYRNFLKRFFWIWFISGLRTCDVSIKKNNLKLTLDLLFSTFLKLVHVQINCIFFDNTLYIYNIYVTEALQHMKHKRKYVNVI